MAATGDFAQTVHRGTSRAVRDLENAGESEDGYSLEHATKPQTIGYGLVDSPAALSAWIIEKFYSWSDCDGDLDCVFIRDELLDNLMLYWLPGTGASSARLYWESFQQVQRTFRSESTDTITVPTGCSIFPKENPRPSRRWAAKRFVDIRYWNEPVKGGRFAAFEQPQLFVDEVRNCFRSLGAQPDSVEELVEQSTAAVSRETKNFIATARSALEETAQGDR